MRYAVLVWFWIAAGCSSGGIAAVLEGVVSLNQTTLRIDLSRVGGIISEVASVTVPYTETNATRLVANVVADFNNDGTILDYSAGGPTQEEWILQNVLILVTNAEVSTFFRLVDFTVANAATVSVRIVLSIDDLAAAPQLGDTGGLAFEGDVPVVVSDRVPQAFLVAGFIGSGSGSPTRDQWLNETPGSDLDLGSLLSDGEAFYRPGLPDVQQGRNSCVLHTIAGAISWLSRTYDFAGKVNDTDLGVDVASVEGVNELAFDINDKGGMNYTANDGVLNTILLTGKDAYVAAKKLPIESRLVTTNIFAEMQQAMKAGKTVELSLRFQPAGAHMVGVAGYSTKEKGGSTVMRTITVHDTDRATFNDTYPVTGTNADKIMKFPLNGQLREATIVSALIECYKPFAIPTAECVGTDGRVTVPCLVFDGRNYPVYQFSLAPGTSPSDLCKEPHWHGGPAFPLTPPAGGTGEKIDPPGNPCGFGTQKTVPTSNVRIPFSEFQSFLSAHPAPP